MISVKFLTAERPVTIGKGKLLENETYAGREGFEEMREGNEKPA